MASFRPSEMFIQCIIYIQKAFRAIQSLFVRTVNIKVWMRVDFNKLIAFYFKYIFFTIIERFILSDDTTHL